jgi:hypothetical protein
MRTKADVLRIAADQIGVTELPAGSNKVKYNTAYYGRTVSGAAYPWCMAFVWWVFRQAGFNLLKTASCTVLTTAYQKAGQWVTKDFKSGDIAMFDFSAKKKKTQHVGIIEAVYPKYVVTIEGNTGLTNQDNGGAVMRRKRYLKYVTGACRPGYNL